MVVLSVNLSALTWGKKETSGYFKLLLSIFSRTFKNDFNSRLLILYYTDHAKNICQVRVDPKTNELYVKVTPYHRVSKTMTVLNKAKYCFIMTF